MKARIKVAFRYWQRYHLSFVLAGILVIFIIFMGLHDRGMILGFIATTIILLEFTYRWRKIRYFFILGLSSFLGAIFLSFLHEVVVKPMVLIMIGDRGLNTLGFHLFSDAASLIILFLGVMGVVIGAAGMAILGISRLVNLVSRGRAADSA